MQKMEFEERVGQVVSDTEYKVIETVYQWHPSIQETSGKEEVAGLYRGFGMAIFHDMLPRAELLHAKAEVERIKAEMGGLYCK